MAAGGPPPRGGTKPGGSGRRLTTGLARVPAPAVDCGMGGTGPHGKDAVDSGSVAGPGG